MENTTILIVEDEFIVAADLANNVEKMGYNVIGTAATAEEAIDLANQFCPQLVLMDVLLNGKPDGIKAASAIQELCDHCPVIFLPGSDQTAAIDAADLPGPYSVIFKPFRASELASQIERMLNPDSKTESSVQSI